jgi:hypothetical protein
VLSDTTITNVKVFGLTRTGLETTIYRTLDGFSNHYATDAVLIKNKHCIVRLFLHIKTHFWYFWLTCCQVGSVSYTVKLVHVVTGIKLSHIRKGHVFHVLSQNNHINWTFFYDVTFNKKSPILVPNVTSYYMFDYWFIYTTRDHDYKQ